MPGIKMGFPKLEKSLVGICGVFHVSAELSQRGWMAMPTIRNTKGIDIIATKNGKSVNLQVKTRSSGGKAQYTLSAENELLVSDDLYYAFVTLKSESERPDFYIVPSKIVSEYIRKTHAFWSTMTPRANKKAYEKATPEEIAKNRKSIAIRSFPNYVGIMLPEFRDFKIDVYREKWDALLKVE